MVRSRPAKSLRPTSRSLPVSCSSCPKPFTTRTPVTAPSTTPATAAAWLLRVPGGGVEPGAAALGDPPQGGGDGERDRVSSGDSHAMITREMRKSRTLPIIIGSMKSRPWMSWRSLVARPTTWPVDSSSWRRPSSRVIVAVHLGPQVVLDVEGEPAAVVAADVGEDVDDERGGDQQAGPDRHGRTPPPTTTSSMITLVISGTSAMTAMPAERGAEREHHVAPVPPAVAGQPPRPALSPGRRFRARARRPVTVTPRPLALRRPPHVALRRASRIAEACGAGPPLPKAPTSWRREFIPPRPRKTKTRPET